LDELAVVELVTEGPTVAGEPPELDPAQPVMATLVAASAANPIATRFTVVP
jgi:hypothetical protein